MTVFEQICQHIYLHADAGIIFFYRLTGIPIVNFLIGTFCLAFLCVLVGEIFVSVALKFNRRYIDQMSDEILEKERLSIAAYESGDQKGYKALNQQATDAWGKSFFTMVAHSAGILCPLPFALGWMSTRFSDVEFLIAPPLSLLFGKTVGYAFAFIPLYILSRILFKTMRPHLPYFKGVQKMLDAAEKAVPAAQGS